MQTTFNFAHHKLDCYRASRDLADLVMVAALRIPDGHHKMKDQIVRAATGVEALIAEGADLTAGASDDIFVAKLRPDGGHLWSRVLGDSGSLPVAFVAVGDADRLIVAGTYSASIDFGGGNTLSDLQAAPNAFVAQLGP